MEVEVRRNREKIKICALKICAFFINGNTQIFFPHNSW